MGVQGRCMAHICDGKNNASKAFPAGHALAYKVEEDVVWR